MTANAVSRTFRPNARAQIRGSNFGRSAGAVHVYFGSLQARVLSVSDSRIAVRIPRRVRRQSQVDVTVVVNGVRSNALQVFIR